MAGMLTGLVARPLLALAGAAALVVVGFGAGELYEHRRPQGLPLSLLGQGLATQRGRALVQVGRLQRDVSAAQATARGWEARARAGDSVRDAERRTDVAAAQGLSTACEARIAAARSSADAIARLVSRPPATTPMPASGRCPARETISGSELDAALPH